MDEKTTIALFGNSHQKGGSLYTRRVFQRLKEHGARILMEHRFYDFICKTDGPDFVPDGLIDGPDFTAELCISMGGDGTFLHTACIVGNKEIPILGINLGRLGFMADVRPDEIDSMVESLFAHRLYSERRSVLQVTAENGTDLGLYPFALNEVAVLKHDISAMIGITATVDGELLGRYMADGLIIATPTGSTGYALSVGGPIVAPAAPCIEVAPVAPHSLGARPIVLPDSVSITLSIESRSDSYLVAVDGRSRRLEAPGSRLIVKRAPYQVLMVRDTGKTYFDSLREKLMWGVDTRG